MGIIRNVLLTGTYGMTGGVVSVGAGMAYLASNTRLTDLSMDDPMFKSPDDCIKRIPLSKIKPELRDDEGKLTLEFVRGVWGRWGYWPHSKYQALYDQPPPALTPGAAPSTNLWSTSSLLTFSFPPATRFSNHFEVVSNSGHPEIVVRCGRSPATEPGLRHSDGLIFFSASIDRERQEAVLSLKSALFDSKTDYPPAGGESKGKGGGIENERQHPVPPKIAFLHRWYVRILVQSAAANVKV